MHKILLTIGLFLSGVTPSVAQNEMFPVPAIQDDLRFIRRQLFQAHANPFSQLTQERYQAYLDSLITGVTVPLSAEAFQKVASLALLPLGDEHAAISAGNGTSGGNAPDWADSVATNISYRRFGDTGYIFARSFATRGNGDLRVYERCIDSIFALIRRDRITRLAIDVSRNDGGASAVGGMLIDHFHRKPYRSYSMNWKRSEQYLARLTSWGFNDETYEKAAPGEILPFPASTIAPNNPRNPFSGKVIVIVGPGTFSSAIMFATLVQDNKMALLAGEPPANGHPTHFGEMYSVTLPNTGLGLRFGVKEWVRPAGRGAENKLVPDIPCKLPANGNLAALLKQLPW